LSSGADIIIQIDDIDVKYKSLDGRLIKKPIAKKSAYIKTSLIGDMN
jgi:hypothetical protein